MNCDFLFNNNAENFELHPKQAIEIYETLLDAAQSHLKLENWDEAATLYGAALETAEIVLSSKLYNKKIMQQYLKIAMEFTYALHKSQLNTDLHYVADIVRKNIASRLSISVVNTFMEVIYDIAFLAESDADDYIAILLDIDIQKNKLWH